MHADFASENEGNTGYGEYLTVYKLFEGADDPEGMFTIAHRLGFTLRFTNLPEARKWSERAVEMARGGFPPLVLAGALSNLADVVKMQGDFSFALSLHLEATDLFEKGGDRENAIWGLTHQADLYREQGEAERARSKYLEALEWFRRIACSHGIASCLHDLAAFEAADGRLDRARGMYQECLRLYGPGNVSDLPRVLEALARVSLQCGQPDRALTLGGAVAAIRERFGLRGRQIRRGQTDPGIEAAREQMGAEGAAFWMKGRNMSVEEIVDWAVEG
jgi:tetratricopeptide (TPR) repeat protein